ncbi:MULTISPECIES: hypothetical protein [unclassified Duganella]|uniref:hypothetical protein n=1 Tax=unclassified Duganella TaxID=2636909 RepID=UPI0006F47599|nr:MULTISPECIES: hypothetical protein [unclassified Duganella]KQV47544.1 hypothetical protein ASD07_11425 [Duganella sp. Root336D2]KRC00043.1 hypothetical protein ASE26_23710 [Duganella sp. Root198D2]
MRIPLMFAALALCGCSTPKPAMEQANHGVGLIAQLESSLTEFRRVEGNSMKARADSLLAQRKAIAFVDREKQRDLQARVAAGDKLSATLIDNLVANTEGLALSQAEYSDTNARNEAAVAALLAPITDTRSGTSTAQARLAEMGEELGWDIRRSELQAFIKAVKDSVEEGKKKIEEAEKKANN